MVAHTRGTAVDRNFVEVSRLVTRGGRCGGRPACARHTAIEEDGTVSTGNNVIFIEEVERPDVQITTDVLIIQSMFGDSDLNVLEEDVRFDTCSDQGMYYYVYRVMAHEAGHALGVSYRSIKIGDPNESRFYVHPSIDIYPTSMRHNTCTPFPLDVMAIYALYQTYQEIE